MVSNRVTVPANNTHKVEPVVNVSKGSSTLVLQIH